MFILCGESVFFLKKKMNNLTLLFSVNDAKTQPKKKTIIKFYDFHLLLLLHYYK